MDERLTDGGPAFPMNNGPNCFANPGMSLRDWFAGQAIAGISTGEPINDYAQAAKQCYATADAMLAEREAKP